METEASSYWFELDEERCPCRGSGWAEVDVDMHKTCPIHYNGQLHPHTRNLLADDAKRLQEEEKKSRLKFKIQEGRQQVAELENKLRETQRQIVSWELELINRTPTRRLVKSEYLEVTEEDLILEDDQ